jgi:HPt (histidine-containing phosphotransfer) domain-containing protein
LRAAKLATAGYDFGERLRSDAVTLMAFRAKLREAPNAAPVPDGLQSCVHKLAGAAGVFEFKAVSNSASALEDAIIERSAGRDTPGKVETNLDALLACIERE